MDSQGPAGWNCLSRMIFLAEEDTFRLDTFLWWPQKCVWSGHHSDEERVQRFLLNHYLGSSSNEYLLWFSPPRGAKAPLWPHSAIKIHAGVTFGSWRTRFIPSMYGSAFLFLIARHFLIVRVHVILSNFILSSSSCARQISHALQTHLRQSFWNKYHL